MPGYQMEGTQDRVRSEEKWGRTLQKRQTYNLPFNVPKFDTKQQVKYILIEKFK